MTAGQVQIDAEAMNSLRIARLLGGQNPTSTRDKGHSMNLASLILDAILLGLVIITVLRGLHNPYSAMLGFFIYPTAGVKTQKYLGCAAQLFLRLLFLVVLALASRSS